MNTPGRKDSADPNLDPARNPDLYRLIEVIGAPQARAQIAQQVMALKKQFTPRTLALTNWRRETFQSVIESKIQLRINPEAMAARWAPVLLRHFTPDEIKSILQFYESPAGRRLIAEQSAVLQESYAATQEWRRESIEEIRKEMDVEFPGARETQNALDVSTHKP